MIGVVMVVGWVVMVVSVVRVVAGDGEGS